MLFGRALVGDTSCFGEILDDRFHVIAGDPFGDNRPTGQSLPMDEVVLGTPFDGVRFINIMGAFLAPEAERTPDLWQRWLPKACNFPIPHHGEIQCPPDLPAPLQIESELAVVVGRTLRQASPAEVLDSIFGWTVFNDVTAPHYSELGGPMLWVVAKSIDGFASWGPWIRTDLTEDRVMEGLEITARANGVEIQRGNTSRYRLFPSAVLSDISHRITLFPGDVVTLGTPPPPPDVAIGDVIECEVEEVGVLTNYIVEQTKELPSTMPRRVRVSPTR